MLFNRKLRVREIVEVMGTYHGTTVSILNYHYYCSQTLWYDNFKDVLGCSTAIRTSVKAGEQAAIEIEGFPWRTDAEVGLSAKKVMATLFRDTVGIIHIYYLQKGGDVNDYSKLLNFFKNELKKKNNVVWIRSDLPPRQCKIDHMRS